jgi:hypothetical protein
MTSMTPKCPKCGSIVYSRRNVLCGVCGERLPPELLFTPEQCEEVERDLQALKQRERETRRRESESSSDLSDGMDIGGV